MAARLAALKADSGAQKNPEHFILAADTVVASGRRIFDKPQDKEQARRAIEHLSGRRHRVYGGVSLIAPDGTRRHRLVVTQVQFKRLTPGEVDRYLATEDWHGKAGGYGIQGLGGAFVKKINGSYSNVVGLALCETLALLRGLGAGCHIL